jgi:hypothetical protein
LARFRFLWRVAHLHEVQQHQQLALYSDFLKDGEGRRVRGYLAKPTENTRINPLASRGDPNCQVVCGGLG